MFVLNLLFDFGKNTGRFSGDRPGNLNQSMNWLQLDIVEEPLDPRPPAFNPERPNIWSDLGEANTLLIPTMAFAPNGADPANIAFRIQSDPDPGATPAPPDAQVQLVVSFGRPVKGSQNQAAGASPFTHNDQQNGRIQTTFTFGPVPRNSPSTGPAGVAWFFPLQKRITRRPNSPFLTNRFEFSVGVIVSSAATGEIRHYGEDPEMDIGE